MTPIRDDHDADAITEGDTPTCRLLLIEAALQFDHPGVVLGRMDDPTGPFGVVGRELVPVAERHEATTGDGRPNLRGTVPKFVVTGATLTPTPPSAGGPQSAAPTNAAATPSDRGGRSSSTSHNKTGISRPAAAAFSSV